MTKGLAHLDDLGEAGSVTAERATLNHPDSGLGELATCHA
jgi:hypothetical protein